MTTRIDARGCGTSWQPLLDGRPVGTPRGKYDQAIAVAQKLEQAARAKSRTCMNCRQSFISSGPGHRLCQDCRGMA